MVGAGSRHECWVKGEFSETQKTSGLPGGWICSRARRSSRYSTRLPYNATSAHLSPGPFFRDPTQIRRLHRWRCPPRCRATRRQGQSLSTETLVRPLNALLSIVVRSSGSTPAQTLLTDFPCTKTSARMLRIQEHRPQIAHIPLILLYTMLQTAHDTLPRCDHSTVSPERTYEHGHQRKDTIDDAAIRTSLPVFLIFSKRVS